MIRRTHAALVVAMLTVGACDPIWQVGARIRDPRSRPVEAAIVVFGCPAGVLDGAEGLARATGANGTVRVVGMGLYLPSCDLFVIKRGYQTAQIPFAQICPRGREHCPRAYEIEVVLQPE